MQTKIRTPRVRSAAIRTVALLALIVTAVCFAFAQYGSSAAQHVSPLVGAAACASCHEEETRTWGVSLHREAFRDPWFQAGYRIDHRGFCRDCHSPLSTGRDPAPGTLAHDEGVTCTECHLPVGRAEHPTATPLVDFRARACGDCHQFHFPADSTTARIEPSEWMQRTVEEWRESGRAESCVDCHMGADGHAFTVASDIARIASAIHVEGTVRSLGSTTEVRVMLRNVGAGHAVPTGDVLRALELSVWPASASNEAQQVTLSREFGTTLRLDPQRGLSARHVEMLDRRIPPRGMREERFVFAGNTHTFRYRLDSLRALPTQAARQGIPDRENRRTLHEGVLALPR